MIIVLNNKCNLSKEEFIAYYERLKEINTTNKLVLCPSYLHLALANNSNIELGAQNVSTTDYGAYTGEICAKQLKSYNVKYTIVGHSERRINQSESSTDVNNKVKNLLNQNIIPVICIGEEQKATDDKNILMLLEKELRETIKDLTLEDQKQIIIAYEPIWAIGTGDVPSNEEIIKIITFIKQLLPETPVLYGGSVNENNINELKNINILDGFLLGGISLKPDKLAELLKQLSE